MKTYWSTLESAGEPDAVVPGGEEFAPGASDPPEELSRRSLLKLTGATLSLAGLAACRRPVERIVPFVTAPEGYYPGIPKAYATTMPFGLGAYGVVVTSREGRPTKIEGNDLHPASRGGTSAWMQATLLDLYDPDRSASPLSGGEPKQRADFVAVWKALEPPLVASGGAGLAVLSEPFRSPTASRLRAALGERFPRARWATWEPLSEENVWRGVERACGRALLPVHDFTRARIVLCLDADPLHTERDSVRHTREFADARRVRGTSDEMSRLWVVEGAMSLTGANADHRLRVASSSVPAFLAALSGALHHRGIALPAPVVAADESIDAAWISAVADDLASSRGASLVVAGRRQSADVHAAVLALNTVLGNVGATVSYVEPLDAALPSLDELRELVRAMQAGEVTTLLMLGGNPVYDAPADLDFAGALGKVGTSVHLSHAVDETSQKSTWHLPRAHFLEAWGDARSSDGTIGVVQPLIDPLHGGIADIELLALAAAGEEQPTFDLVRATWPVDDGAWNRALHDGLVAGSAQSAAAVEVGIGAFGMLKGRGTTGSDLEVVFRPSPALYDGRFANNGWLLELPDPVTKLTWDNAAQLAPATAARLGVADGDVVRVTLGDRSIEIPAWVVPGLDERTVALDLGWGRTAAGRVGNGAGVDVYRLRTSAALDVASGARLEATGARAVLARTQERRMDALGAGETERRAEQLVREATLEDYRHHPDFAHGHHLPEAPRSMWREHTYETGHQWGMVIDLNACTGCNACVVACQSENNVPIVGKDQVRRGREMHWLRIDRYFSGAPADPEVVFQPLPCMHCENAPCEQVCPVAATVHDAQGLNVMVYNRCIGTRYCSNNCPYKVRRFNFYNFTKDTPQSLRLAANPEVSVRSRGVMEKCTYCVQRIRAGEADARNHGRELADGDIRTACQQACPAQAIAFGDLRNAESRVARARELDRNYTLLDELYTRPRTSYLAKLRNPRAGSEGHA